MLGLVIVSRIINSESKKIFSSCLVTYSYLGTHESMLFLQSILKYVLEVSSKIKAYIKSITMIILLIGRSSLSHLLIVFFGFQSCCARDAIL